MSGVPTEIIEAVEAHGPFRGITARIKLGKIPSDDPIAYQAGYMTALSGAGLDGPRLDLAEAYIDGYKHGVDVKAGRQPRPEFHA